MDLTQRSKDAKDGSKRTESRDQCVDAAYRVHVALGPGLLESVYERVLAHELGKLGHKAPTQVSIPIVYDDRVIDDAFRLISS